MSKITSFRVFSLKRLNPEIALYTKYFVRSYSIDVVSTLISMFTHTFKQSVLLNIILWKHLILTCFSGMTRVCSFTQVTAISLRTLCNIWNDLTTGVDAVDEIFHNMWSEGTFRRDTPYYKSPVSAGLSIPSWKGLAEINCLIPGPIKYGAWSVGQVTL